MKRWISLVLCLCLCFGLLPLSARADSLGVEELTVNGVELSAESCYYRNGASAATSSSDGWNARFEASTGTLYLRDYKGGPVKCFYGDLTVVLAGTNVITEYRADYFTAYGISIQADGDLTICGEGSLSLNLASAQGNVYGIAALEGRLFVMQPDAEIHMDLSSPNGSIASLYGYTGVTLYGAPDRTALTLRLSGSIVPDTTASAVQSSGGSIVLDRKIDLSVRFERCIRGYGIYNGGTEYAPENTGYVHISGNFTVDANQDSAHVTGICSTNENNSEAGVYIDGGKTEITGCDVGVIFYGHSSGYGPWHLFIHSCDFTFRSKEHSAVAIYVPSSIFIDNANVDIYSGLAGIWFPLEAGNETRLWIAGSSHVDISAEDNPVYNAWFEDSSALLGNQGLLFLESSGYVNLTTRKPVEPCYPLSLYPMVGIETKLVRGSVDSSRISSDGEPTYLADEEGVLRFEFERQCAQGPDFCSSSDFTDVPRPGSWAHEGIDFCLDRCLMTGTSSTTFSPNTPMTRAMLVTVLWRLVGSPTGFENPFSDVKADRWYTEPIAWAAANKIVNGTSSTSFDPNGELTREQLAAILYRYSQHLDLDTRFEGDLSGFPDRTSVSSWAYDSMAWAVSKGLISGSSQAGQVRLDPKGKATRAQVATILMRYLILYHL